MNWSQSEFAQRVNTLLDRRGWTQKNLAAEMGIVNPANVSRWLSNENNKPSFSIVVRMASALKTTPCYLAFGNEFEPMDDEERGVVELWRKMSEQERKGFQATFEAITDARQQQKKPGKRTKRQPKDESLRSHLTPQSVAQFQARLEDALLQLAKVEVDPKTRDQTRDRINKIGAALRTLTVSLSGQAEDSAAQKASVGSSGKATDASA